MLTYACGAACRRRLPLSSGRIFQASPPEVSHLLAELLLRLVGLHSVAKARRFEVLRGRCAAKSGGGVSRVVGWGWGARAGRLPAAEGA